MSVKVLCCSKGSQWLALTVLLLGGCQRTLIPTPTVYIDRTPDPFQGVPEAHQTTIFQMPYVTDRAPIERKGRPLRYGHDRSRSLAFGRCSIEIGRDMSWEEVAELSKVKRRGRRILVEAGEKTEIGRFPSVPMPVTVQDGLPTVDPTALAGNLQATEALQDMVRQSLETATKKEVFITVHGVNNTFDDAVLRAADLWHFFGRQAVVICYTWPAGHPGLFEGYHYDHVSSRFTVFHFKQLIRTLAEMEEVHRINVIAHSRGTDVTTSALRELFLEGFGDEFEHNRIGDVVLFAADLDWQVVLQRDVGHYVFSMFDRLTIYVSKDDVALDVSSLLWRSVQRLGRVRLEDLTETERDLIRIAGSIDIIDVRIRPRALGHSYFDDPAVFSDLILLLLDDRPPGASHGRPLEVVVPGFWVLRDGYPAVSADR
ncbi:MAG: alpha/beta hydrolase [Phycisphaerales bacterium]|nr:MAG: alpha/beta hydrolase [Phycisphaerales bacterium]